MLRSNCKGTNVNVQKKYPCKKYQCKINVNYQNCWVKDLNDQSTGTNTK